MFLLHTAVGKITKQERLADMTRFNVIIVEDNEDDLPRLIAPRHLGQLLNPCRQLLHGCSYLFNG